MFAHIRSFQHFAENLSDWSVLAGVTGNPNQRPSDLDGYMTRKGNTLFLEEKVFGANVPLGQEITFSEWATQPDKTIIVLWYEKEYKYAADGSPVIDEHGLHEFDKNYARYQIYEYGKPVVSRMVNDNEAIRRLVKRWYDNANANPITTPMQMIRKIFSYFSSDEKVTTVRKLYDALSTEEKDALLKQIKD